MARLLETSTADNESGRAFTELRARSQPALALGSAVTRLKRTLLTPLGPLP